MNDERRRNPAFNRIIREYQEIESNANSLSWFARPVDFEQPYEWHFTIRGPEATAFDGGIYHGRLMLPTTYPRHPPDIVFLTPNGRFEVGKRICLSATTFHPESWQPAWGISTLLEALSAFLPTPSEGAVGSVEWPDVVRRQHAATSGEWMCPTCQVSNRDILRESEVLESPMASPEGVPVGVNPRLVPPATARFPTSSSEILEIAISSLLARILAHVSAVVHTFVYWPRSPIDACQVVINLGVLASTISLVAAVIEHSTM